MQVISILNHKGGVGKSTISTNLAGYFANNGGEVLLCDFDVQQSAQNWLALRPVNAIPINGAKNAEQDLLSPPQGTTHIIVDSPAGIRNEALKQIVIQSNKIIVPIKPSTFDMMSTSTFLTELVNIVNEQNKNIDVCVVANMVDFKTKSADNLAKFIKELQIDCPAFISQSQIYVLLAANGLSLFDSTNKVFQSEKNKFLPLINWLKN